MDNEIIGRGNRSTLIKPAQCHFIHKSTWPDPGRLCGKPATNRQSYDRAYDRPVRPIRCIHTFTLTCGCSNSRREKTLLNNMLFCCVHTVQAHINIQTYEDTLCNVNTYSFTPIKIHGPELVIHPSTPSSHRRYIFIDPIWCCSVWNAWREHVIGRLRFSVHLSARSSFSKSGTTLDFIDIYFWNWASGAVWLIQFTSASVQYISYITYCSSIL